MDQVALDRRFFEIVNMNPSPKWWQFPKRFALWYATESNSKVAQKARRNVVEAMERKAWPDSQR